MKTYAATPAELAKLKNNFSFHPVRQGQKERYMAIRKAVGELAGLLLAICPPSRERAIAITHLENGMIWANEAIARNEPAEETAAPPAP